MGIRRLKETQLLVTKERVEIGKYITLKRVGKIHIRQEIRPSPEAGSGFFKETNPPPFTFTYGLLIHEFYLP